MSRGFALLTALIVVGLIAFLGGDILHDLQSRAALARRVESLPAFEVTDLQGNVHALADRGRPTMLLFFRTTCPYCESELHEFVESGSKLQAADIFLISAEPADTLRTFRDDLGLRSLTTGTLAVDVDRVIETYFGIESIPAVFVYNSAGKLVGRHVGKTPVATIIETITRASRKG